MILLSFLLILYKNVIFKLSFKIPIIIYLLLLIIIYILLI